MSIIRQSTARTVLVGPVLDSSGAAKTDEVVGSIKVTKNGTVGAANGSTTLTHDHAGKYKLAMAAGDADTVGVLEISLNSGNNDMPVARFNVVEEAVWEAYFASSATMPVTLAADSITASVFDESTAFPLKSADTGSTAVARTGADSDTLETLSDQLDAQLTQADVRSAVGLSSANLDTQLGDLPTNAELSAALAAADDAVLAAIAALNNLSAAGAQAAAAAALTAYAAAKTSDVPSAATNASAVRTELAPELGRVDVAVSTRLATAGYTAPANSDITAIKAKTDNLPASPAATGDIPSASTNASAVRTELATELGRVDVATSTRLAAAGYTAPANSDISAIKTVTDKLDTTLVQDGVVYDFTAAALAAAPTGGGGDLSDLEDAVEANTVAVAANTAAVGALETAVDDLEASCDTLYDRIKEDVPDGPINVIPAPETSMQTVAWCICYDINGQTEENVYVYIRVKSGGSSPAFYDGRVARGVSTESGLAAIVIPRDDTLVFEAKRGNGAWVEFAGVDAEQVELPSAIGNP